MIKTRFAPSPTGDLHIGSLRTALFAYLFAKKNNGQFFLRIEDTDRTRYKEGSMDSILDGLKWAGLKWDNKNFQFPTARAGSRYSGAISNFSANLNSNNFPSVEGGSASGGQTNSKLQIPNFKQYINEGIWFQSSRIDIYKKYADELVKAGHAYPCFCTTAELSQMRTEQSANGQTVTRYDRRCLKLSPEEVAAKLKSQTPHVIRLKVPAKIITSPHPSPLKGDGVDPATFPLRRGETERDFLSFTDLIRGQVEFNLKDIDDQILLKSDGFPTYHLAHMVDDHEMGITHVIRAEEWLPSTPKHIILYQMFGWEIPEFAHLSMILAPDKSKLSKRHGATSVLEFKNLGYLPEAVVNYIALLGWNPGTEQEIFSLKELEQIFDLDKVNKAGAIFDIEKLNWLNGHYIRQKNLDELTNLCLPYLENYLITNYELRITDYGFDHLKSIVGLEQERLKKLSEIGERTKYFFKRPEIDPKMLVWKKSTPAEAKSRLEFLVQFLSQIPEENWTRETLEEALLEEINRQGFGNGDTLWPMRVALSGEEKSPSPFEIAEVLGKEETVERLKLARDIVI